LPEPVLGRHDEPGFVAGLSERAHQLARHHEMAAFGERRARGHDGDRRHYGFTFGVGPLIRLLARFEAGTKSVGKALATVARSATAAIAGRDPEGLLREMSAEVRADDAALADQRYSALFCNTTGTINPYVRPFVGDRDAGSFHFLAYAGSSRSFALMLPLLARGRLPADPVMLRQPLSVFRRGVLSAVGGGGLPVDPRYVNRPAHAVTVKTDESHYTIDGELLPLVSGTVRVSLGPVLQVAVLTPRSLRRFA
jgi:hypothetical protein